MILLNLTIILYVTFNSHQGSSIVWYMKEYGLTSKSKLEKF